MQLDGPLLLVGCGKMGGALLEGWLEGGLPATSVTVVEPYADALQAFKDRGVTVVADASDLAPDYAPAMVVLAVKPQMMDAGPARPTPASPVPAPPSFRLPPARPSTTSNPSWAQGPRRGARHAQHPGRRGAGA